MIKIILEVQAGVGWELCDSVENSFRDHFDLIRGV